MTDKWIPVEEDPPGLEEAVVARRGNRVWFGCRTEACEDWDGEDVPDSFLWGIVEKLEWDATKRRWTAVGADLDFRDPTHFYRLPEPPET